MANKKHEWRKDERMLYPTMKHPSITTVPAQTMITISGQGNPNSPEFAERVGALFAISYAIKMASKKGIDFPDAIDYTVYPLEGYWTMPDDFTGGPIDKEQLVYTIMIKQPVFVTSAVFEQARQLVKDKVPETLLEQLQLTTTTEGLVGMILHVGSFDTEVEDFDRLDYFLKNEGYVRTEYAHKEIYLSDFRRVEEAKRKTLLRVKIAKRES
ncbi:GyrI-like domain-containing protein [Furfurilactobacillus entadae]|uniref:GyrI-like domain-containing protein n=1 Tax=Furfurilactobacillus entadae TaxID=2922307 RepID=UPI0035E65A90